MDSISVSFPMPIITERLLIQPPQEGDGIILNAAILESFDNVRHTMPWVKEKPTVVESEAFVKQAVANWIVKKDEEPYLPLFIFNKDNHHFIGATGFHHIVWETPSLEIGYWIRNQCAGQGFMTEAVGALVQYAIQQLGMQRIIITCNINNVRSKKIPERLGFNLETTLKGNRVNPVNGELSDTLVFVKLAEK